jgi:hemolysin III
MESYNRKQETANSLIHGVGIIFGISSLPILVALAIHHDNTPAVAGAAIYGFSFLFLFTSSTIYHITEEPRLKKIFKVLDHISIYFLISGTYTPFLLIYLNNAFGVSLLCILWGLTVIGIGIKIFFTGRFDLLSTIIYLLMGLILIVGGRRFFIHVPKDVLFFVCIGGGLYIIGVLFYLWDKYFYSHAVWHVFVLAGAICHYVAVLLSV